MDKPTAAKYYRRSLAAANPKLGWPEIPDCPMEFFAQMLANRELAHPEAAVPTVEYRASRMFSGEAAWQSEKINNIQPEAWRAEYAWLFALALADGTFEAQPRLVWSTAYAYNRPDWSVAQVEKLLDEFERVGLLERKTKDGKIWGHWVGAKLLPKAEYVKSHRYKTGRIDIFNSASAALEQRQRCAIPGTGVGVGVGVGEGEGTGEGSDAAKSSENEQPQKIEQVKIVSEEEQNLLPNTVAPKPEAFTNRIEYGAACHAAGVLPVSRAEFKSREVLPRDEYLHEKGKPATDAAVAEWAAELAQREPCPVCRVKHPTPFCKPPLAVEPKASQPRAL